MTKTQLTFKGQVTKGESVIKTYESPLYSLQIATDLEKDYTTAAVKSLSSKNLLPLITVFKDDGVFQVQLSTSGVSGFTADEIIEICLRPRDIEILIEDLTWLVNESNRLKESTKTTVIQLISSLKNEIQLISNGEKHSNIFTKGL